jgi:hypothetical protein
VVGQLAHQDVVLAVVLLVERGIYREAEDLGLLYETSGLVLCTKNAYPIQPVGYMAGNIYAALKSMTVLDCLL